MANDIEIRVTGSDGSGPAMQSATRNAQSLRAEVAKVSTSMSAATRTADRMSDAIVGLAGASGTSSRALARLDTEMLSLGRGAASADERVDELRQSLADLGRADAQVRIVDAGRERAELRKAVDAGALLPDVTRQGGKIGEALGQAVGSSAGPQVVAGLTARLTSIGAGLGPAAAAIGAPLAAGIAVWLGASVAGAIIGGAGAGGVVGGLTIASKHSAVQQAATALGDEFEATMQQAAVGFVPAAVQGIGVLRSHLGEARDDLESIFANSSRFVVPLAEGAGQAVRSVLGGVRDLVEQADPVIDSIADGMIRIGDAAGDGLSSLADNADSGARALSILFLLVEQGVRGFSNLVNVLAETWELMEIGGAALSGNLPQLVGLIGEMATRTDEGEESNSEFAQSLQEILAGFRGEEDAAMAAAQALREYADAADRIVDQNLDVAESTLRYRDTLREAKDAIESGRKVTDDESESLLRLARQSNTLTEALEQQGATTGELAERNRQAREDFVSTAVAMGHSRERAEELADQYLKIPTKVSTEIEADTGQAARNLRSVRDLLAQIRSKRVVVTSVIRSEGRMVPIGDGVGGRAHGGITGAAAGGLRGNLTWVGESGPELLELPPSTMVHPAGESQRMAAGMAAPSGPMVIEVHPAGRSDTALMDAVLEGLRFVVRVGGGNVQTVVGTGEAA
ncbi:hypothetical protein E1258_09520 [Micromonospora sp. KC207]|uniref:hypothetical protein n=1 Tax=Micromonospora sp. KC207 TaxID=2530377 RepID=UPI00104E944E|nr:hypothetical protein [Micromonospora sp. KC207]TDC63875.1 hypothetical protein E1258_09520 [Micromonospora sp. KC207]